MRRLTLQTGLGQGAYQHPTPSVHGLWPEVAPYGTSECAAVALDGGPAPRRPVYDATGEGTSHIIQFETHEWEKHGECAGVRDARAYLTTVCGLAEQPLQAMTAARKAGGGLDAARRAVMGLGLEIFAVDEQHSQLLLSACSDGDTWTLSPVEKFPEACGKQRGAARRRVGRRLRRHSCSTCRCARARTCRRQRKAMGEEPPAGLTKQQLALLEAGDKPSTGEKPSPPSSTTTWSEIAPPSVSSAESWAEVEAVAPDLTPIPDLMEKTRFSHALYRITPEEMCVLVEKLDDMCPTYRRNHQGRDDINIDKIDARTFRELDRYVNECLAKK